MLEMTHKTFYLFLGRVHSPGQQVLHKVFDIRRGELLLAREIALPRLTDDALKAYRDAAPDALRDIDDMELINIVKNKSSVFLIFQLSCADVDRLFGIRIRTEKPVPEQTVYDMIAEVTNIMCFEQTAVSLLMQETINLSTIPSTVSTISACTSVTDEGKVLFAVGLLALCLMTVTPFADTPKRIHHLILDLIEYEFTLESNLYSDALVDMVTRMCIIAGPCAPLDGLPIAFNEIVTIPVISRFIKDIDDYCKVEPEAGQVPAPTAASFSSSSVEIGIQLMPCNGYDNSITNSVADKIIDNSSNHTLPGAPGHEEPNDTVSLLLEHGPMGIHERLVENDVVLPSVHKTGLDIKACQDTPIEVENKDVSNEYSPKHMHTGVPYASSNRDYAKHEPELYDADERTMPLRSTSARLKTYSTNADTHVRNRVVDIVTTGYLAAESSRGKGRCKSVSFKSKRQDDCSIDPSDITLIARREYIRYY